MAAKQSIAFVLIGLMLGVGLGCSRKPKTQKEAVSYTIGAQFGKSLKAQNLSLDTKALANGIVDGYKDAGLKLNEAEMNQAIAKLGEERQNEMKAESDKNKTLAEEFLAKNREEEGIEVSDSGLQYRIVEKGEGPSPKGDDLVVVNYRGKLIDGTEFDSSYKRNEPTQFPLKGVIPGWSEGLSMMKKGGKAEFFIPPELAYGDRPRQNIPANAVLIFEVELVDIKKPKAAKQTAKTRQ